MPGHGSWGAAHPEIMACPDVLDPTVDATYDLLGRFFREMAGIFIDDYFFLGGDEVKWKCFENNTAVVSARAALHARARARAARCSRTHTHMRMPPARAACARARRPRAHPNLGGPRRPHGSSRTI